MRHLWHRFALRHLWVSQYTVQDRGIVGVTRSRLSPGGALDSPRFALSTEWL